MKVLIIDPIHEDGLALFASRPDIDLVHLTTPDEAAIATHMADADALLLRGRTLDPVHFESAKRLRLVSRHGVGCDNLDLPALESRGIGVAIAANANAVSVAEHAMTLMLAALKRLPAADAAVRANDWQVRDRLGASDLGDAAVLIVGFGRIGQAVARRCLAFEAAVSFHDPFVPPGVVPVDGVSRADDLSDGVAAADIVTIHMPQTETTAGLFGADLLACFRPGSILVNTARGGIVDERSLLHALDRAHPAVYATDVLASEPPAPDDPLIHRGDVIVTPHSAALTGGGLRRMATGAAQNILDFVDGRLDPAMTVLAPREGPETPNPQRHG